VDLADGTTFEVPTGVEQRGKVPTGLAEGLHADSIGDLVMVRPVVNLKQAVAIFDDIRKVVGIAAYWLCHRGLAHAGAVQTWRRLKVAFRHAYSRFKARPHNRG
jgi:hypothetical protein